MLTIFFHILDILTTAFILYSAFVLLKTTRSIYILRGFLGLGIFYIIAVLFDLRLTTSLFQAFISFFIIILVVLFQKEIRRFVENFSIDFFMDTISNERSVRENVIEAVINTVAYLSKNKMGAIIILPGNQNIERLLEGGTVLNGKVSEPLLLSIFDPSTPGHDGAIVIEGDLVKKFMIHLPLADFNKKYPRIGTRHRAALGLSERSDALTIVVSEERGTITIARDGELNMIHNPEKLKEEIIKFIGFGVSKTKEDKIKNIIFSDGKNKLYILIASIVLWYLVAYR